MSRRRKAPSHAALRPSPDLRPDPRSLSSPPRGKRLFGQSCTLRGHPATRSSRPTSDPLNRPPQFTSTKSDSTVYHSRPPPQFQFRPLINTYRVALRVWIWQRSPKSSIPSQSSSSARRGRCDTRHSLLVGPYLPLGGPYPHFSVFGETQNKGVMGNVTTSDAPPLPPPSRQEIGRASESPSHLPQPHLVYTHLGPVSRNSGRLSFPFTLFSDISTDTSVCTVHLLRPHLSFYYSTVYPSLIPGLRPLELTELRPPRYKREKQ